MSPATTRLLLIGSAFLTGLMLCFVVVLLVVGRGPGTVATPSAVGGPFRLVNQDGRTVTEQDIKGRPTLVFFGFTHCPDVCPTTLFEVSEVLEKLGPDAAKVNAFFITVDPERDTPETLKAYLSSFNPRLQALSGDAEAIEKVAKAYRVYYRKVPLDQGGYTMDHTALVYLMDKDGAFVAPFNLKRTAEAAAEDLRRYF